MFNEVPEKEREKKLTDGGLDILGLQNIRLVHREGNAVIKRHLESLPLETFDSVCSTKLPQPLLLIVWDKILSNFNHKQLLDRNDGC